MTILTDLAISNSMSSFVPKYWLNWQILVAIFTNFVDKDEATKVYMHVSSCGVRLSLNYCTMLHQTFIWFPSMKQNAFVCIALGCWIMLNDAECETFNLFVKQISRSLFVFLFKNFHKTLCYRLHRGLHCILLEVHLHLG